MRVCRMRNSRIAITFDGSINKNKRPVATSVRSFFWRKAVKRDPQLKSLSVNVHSESVQQESCGHTATDPNCTVGPSSSSKVTSHRPAYQSGPTMIGVCQRPRIKCSWSASMVQSYHYQKTFMLKEAGSLRLRSHFGICSLHSRHGREKNLNPKGPPPQ